MPSSAITTPIPKKGKALMLAPRDLRLFQSNAAQTPLIPRHLHTSRKPVRYHLTPKRYRIDTRYGRNCSRNRGNRNFEFVARNRTGGKAAHRADAGGIASHGAAGLRRISPSCLTYRVRRVRRQGGSDTARASTGRLSWQGRWCPAKRLRRLLALAFDVCSANDTPAYRSSR